MWRSTTCRARSPGTATSSPAFVRGADGAPDEPSSRIATDATLPRMDERERRMAQNEVLFREVNERVKDIAAKLGDDGGYEYFCECANKDCTFRISMRLADYERLRSDPKQLVV